MPLRAMQQCQGSRVNQQAAPRQHLRPFTPHSGHLGTHRASCGFSSSSSVSAARCPASTSTPRNTRRTPPARAMCVPMAAAPNSEADRKMIVSITGATGLVGSRLVSKLASQGHQVRVLTRDVQAAKGKLPFPGLRFFSQAQWAAAIAGSTGVVNLAGEPIATRWTPDHKAAIKASRVKATQAVVAGIEAAPLEQRPRVLVSASAVGFYGNSQSSSFVEESGSGADYLAEICKEWEAAAMMASSQAGVRTVVLRIGIVLAPDGGALAKMMPVFQIFAGGPLGSGRQWMSWIHRDDLVDLIITALSNQAYSGVYNATAPKPVMMSELCSQLGGIMGRPSWLPVPDFALQTLLGEGATVVLEGQKVLPARTQAQGFNFKYNDVGAALKNILRR
ncbi:epimerase family protein slr1223-like protein [Haematococcus lacustris]